LSLRQFSFADIKAATNNFDGSLHVGAGIYSDVYRGMIYGAGTKVAMKRLHLDRSWNINEFYNNEIQTMSKHHHCPHLVPLLGYCTEETILVYEYMDRGSLLEHLGTQKPALTWKQRIEICIAAARGLRYLHELQIIHGNVKSSNILLNEKWVAKITDLSVCSTELLRHLTVINGPIGYLDPEYMVTGRMTEKSDVYSLGAVLFEVLCDRCAFDYKLPDEQKALTRWALRCKEEGNLDQIIDPYLMGRINPLSLDKFAETAEKCVALQGIDRPSMGDVVSDLECALQLQVNAEATGGLAGGSMSNGAMDRGCGWYRFR
jgi:serine/threonine protein kinase